MPTLPCGFFASTISLFALAAGCAEPADDPTGAAPTLALDGVDHAAPTCEIAGCDPVTPAADADLRGVWISPAGAVWAVGEGGLVGRRAAEDWCWCAPVADVTLDAVWGSADDDVWMVGDGGTILRFDGAGFTAEDAGTSAALHDVWGSGPADVFVVGADGTARRHDGAGWSSADLPTAHTLEGVWGASATDVWAVGTVPVAYDADRMGAAAEVFRWQPDTGTWTAEAAFLEQHGAASFEGISGTGAGDVWAVGIKVPVGAANRFAFAAHYDGTAWSAAATPEDVQIGRTYRDVAVDAPGAEGGCWIAAAAPTPAVRFDGATWSEAASSLTGGLEAIDVRGAAMWAVGGDGKILRWTDAGWVEDQ